MHISVVMPLFNKQDFVLQSVNSALQQKGIELELLIIDDGSTDRSLEIVEKIGDPRIRILRQKNLGPSAARNSGLKEAKHSLIAFLDADDYWAPKKLISQMSYLQTHPETAAVYCQALRVDINGNLIFRKPFGSGIRDENFLLNNLLTRPKTPALGSTLMIRTEILRKIDGFDVEITNGEDMDIQLRLAQAGFTQHMLSRSLAYIRFIHSSQSHSFDLDRWMNSYKSHLWIYKKLLKNDLPEILIDKANAKILNVHLRQFLYYLLIGKKEAAYELRTHIMNDANKLDKNSRDFYTQIEFFTPLIYQKDGWPELERFIEIVLTERGQIIQNSKNPIHDELTRIKAKVWCAGQGNKKIRRQTWVFLFNACRRNPALIHNLNFWKQAARLLIGNLVIRHNIKWHEASMKYL